MKTIIIILAFFSIFSLSHSQIRVNIEINPDEDRAPISPYIYGTNGNDYDSLIPARRIGGNRMTGYNWENNASNAGSDYYHQSDNYLTWSNNIPPNKENIPGIVLTAFHDSSLKKGAYTLMTIPMAGYVARDKKGQVLESEKAPSSRWVKIKNTKSTPYSIFPDTSDGFVYTDQLLNYLLKKYGNASSATGIKAYALDNEPGLWFYTHPRIKPEKTTISELIGKSIDLAGTIKSMDSTAEVFGPVLYGFNAFRTLQDAPDWNEYKNQYPTFIDTYLDLMKKASDSAGKRLVDVLDIHWYPEPEGVSSGDTSRQAVRARIQCIRSLWDSTYKEESWIGIWFSPVALFYSLKSSISKYNPGTKLAITEYDWGAPNHISGGIAQADALGIFGKYGVYFASKWNSTDGYIRSAFNIFRNTDGEHSGFGDVKVKAVTSDYENTSVYASIEKTNSHLLHVVVINKNIDSTITAQLTINNHKKYSISDICYFDGSSTAIKHLITSDSLSISNVFSFDIPPLSVWHYFLKEEDTGIPVSAMVSRTEIYPNPSDGRFNICLPENYSDGEIIKIVNEAGLTVFEKKLSTSGSSEIQTDLSAGVYYLSVSDCDVCRANKLVVVK